MKIKRIISSALDTTLKLDRSFPIHVVGSPGNNKKIFDSEFESLVNQFGGRKLEDVKTLNNKTV